MRMNHLALALLATSAICRPYGFESLTLFYPKKEDVPSDLEDFYVEKNGRWELAVQITGVEGAKSFSDFANLSEALRKERGDHRKLRELIRGKFGDKPMDELFAHLQSQIERIPELEALAAGDDKDGKKIDKAVEARLKALLGPVERERDQYKAQVAEREQTINNFKAEKRTRAIHDGLREAATKAKLLPEAIDDMLLLGERVFDVDEETGAISVKENSGYQVGDVPDAWLTSMQVKRPHWWGQTSGGGSGGGNNRSGVKNPWLKATWNLTEQGQLVKTNPTLANQLAAAAGTKVGGLPVK